MLLTNGLDSHRQVLSSRQAGSSEADSDAPADVGPPLAEPELVPTSSGVPGKAADEAEGEVERAVGDAHGHASPKAENARDATGTDTFRKATRPGLSAVQTNRAPPMSLSAVALIRLTSVCPCVVLLLCICRAAASSAEHALERGFSVDCGGDRGRHNVFASLVVRRDRRQRGGRARTRLAYCLQHIL